MQLYTRVTGNGPPVILLHGLFGSNDNLGGLARGLADLYTVYALDLRNHGRSPHGVAMDYPTLAADVIETMEAHGCESVALVGHSLGGKTAMELALSHPARVNALAILDIAPVTYKRHHDSELDAMVGLELGKLNSRKDADQALMRRIPNPNIRQFLLKNLMRSQNGYAWRIPLETIQSQYPDIAEPPTARGPYSGPALFIRGGASDYVAQAHEPEIHRRFPNARIETIAGAAHWIHVEYPERVRDQLGTFLEPLIHVSP